MKAIALIPLTLWFAALLITLAIAGIIATLRIAFDAKGI